jgi:hypothetical protein
MKKLRFGRESTLPGLDLPTSGSTDTEQKQQSQSRQQQSPQDLPPDAANQTPQEASSDPVVQSHLGLPSDRLPAVLRSLRTENEQLLAHAVLHSTTDVWVAMKGKPTLQLKTPWGPVYLCCSRKAHNRLISEGKVVLSPLEVDYLLAAINKDKLARSKQLLRGEEERSALPADLLEQIVACKRVFPGTKLKEVLIFSGLTQNHPEEEELSEFRLESPPDGTKSKEEETNATTGD